MVNNVIDSSAWLEYFAGSPRARYFAAAIEATDQLVVPSISLYEVFKKVLTERDETAALQVVHYMQLGTVVDLSNDLALAAATLSKRHRLPMADSIILATAQFANAEVWTQDSDFENIPGVRYFRKK